MMEEKIFFDPIPEDLRKFRIFRGCFIVFLISLTLAFCIPTKEEAAFIYIAPKVINEDVVKDGMLKDEGLNYLRGALDG